MAPSDKSRSASRARPLSSRKKLVFSLLTTAALFALLELLLAAIGVRPVSHEEDPYVGFSAYSPVFVEQQLRDGRTRMATAEYKRQWFNDQRFDSEKPQGTYRIFCVGGSTTYGHPYDDATSFSGWLREFLPAADGSRRWEVINAGGISYASYRVANVVEELARYKPDMIIVLSGHNEFLERRTYASAIETPEMLRDLVALVGRLRTYAALHRMVRGPADLGPREILPAEVDAVLDHTIGPESYTRDEELNRHVVEHYRFNFDRIVDIARSAGSEVLFITPASNLADCSPFKSEHRSGLAERDRARWQALVDRAIPARESGEWETALQALDEAAAIDDRHAELHFLRGQILLEMGRAGDAKAAFRRARDEDVCPLRATTPICRAVTDVAADRQVPLIDFIGLVEDRSPHGIPGEGVFLDHVHPPIAINRLLALAIIDQLVAEGVVRPTPSWNEDEIERITLRVEASVDAPRQAVALRNLSKVLGWAGKTDEADRLALRAVELDPGDAESQYQAGNARFRRGELDRAAEHYQQAIRHNPRLAETHYALGRVRAEQGDLNEAREHYKRALQHNPRLSQAHYELGLLHETLNEPEAAAAHYADAVRINPRDFRSLNNLAILRTDEGRPAEAIALLERAVRANPEFVHARLNLCALYASAGRHAEARAEYREIIRLEPKLADEITDLRRQIFPDGD